MLGKLSKRHGDPPVHDRPPSRTSARCSFPTSISAAAAARRTCCSTSCATTMPRRSISSATSSTAGACKRGWYWPQEHNDVVQKLLRKARKGSRVVYIPGNHDEFLRDYVGIAFRRRRGRRPRPSTRRPTGKRLLVIHGDQFDVVVRHAALARPSRRRRLFDARARAQHRLQPHPPPARPHLLVAVGLDQAQGQERRELHRRLRAGARQRGAARRRRRRRLRPYPPRPDRETDGFRYVNAGDWVESCTALVEHHDGRLEIIRWTEMRGPLDARRRRPTRSRACRGQPREAAHRDRRLASAGQRRRPHARTDWRAAARSSASRCRCCRPAEFRTVPLPTYPGDPARPSPGRRRSPPRSTRPGPTPSISPPRARSASPCAAGASRNGRPFTTSYHTRFPEYLARARCRSRERLTYAVLRRFHNAGRGCMVATTIAARRARRARLQQPRCSGRAASTASCSGRAPDARARPAAADLPLRRPRRGREEHRGLPRPRPARQQGGGRRRPGAAGAQGRAIRRRISSACGPARRWPRPMPAPTSSSSRAAPTPSASCCSRRWPPALPVAAYPVPGPLDVIGGSGVGVLDEDLRAAALAALAIPRERCRAFALEHELGGLAPASSSTTSSSAQRAGDRLAAGGLRRRRRADTGSAHDPSRFPTSPTSAPPPRASPATPCARRSSSSPYPRRASPAARVLLKCENLQRTGSFKFRGAYNALARARPPRRGRAASSRSPPATTPRASPRRRGCSACRRPSSCRPTRRRSSARGPSGAARRIVTYDRASEDREAVAATRHRRARRRRSIHPYNDAARHRRAGDGRPRDRRRLRRRWASCRTLVAVPCSGGGLSARASAWPSGDCSRDCAVVLVEPEGFDDYAPLAPRRPDRRQRRRRPARSAMRCWRSRPARSASPSTAPTTPRARRGQRRRGARRGRLRLRRAEAGGRAGRRGRARRASRRPARCARQHRRDRAVRRQYRRRLLARALAKVEVGHG